MASYTKDILNFDLIKENLDKIEELTYVTENTTKLPIRVKVKDQEYKITTDGQIKVGFDADDVKNAPGTYYGKYVTNYNSPYDAGITEVNGQLGKWQIFMADDTNIYLIASNYITHQYTGKKDNVGFTAYGDNNNTTKMDFSSIYSKYNASSTKTDIPSILLKLDKQEKYHKWMSISENQTRNNTNERAVESLLDVDVWAGYNNTQYAKYAIGGPTLEMFCKSYNATRTDDMYKLSEIYEDNIYGYTIKKGETDPSANISNLNTGAVNTTVDDMYFKVKTYNGECWIACPAHKNTSTYYNTDIYCVGYSGSILPRTWTTGWGGRGFRPLVCLNPNVHLVEKTNGKTTTYELELD